MESYCVRCKKCTKNINPRVPNTSNGKTITLSNFATCGNEKSRLIKNQEARVLLSSPGLRTPLSKAPLLSNFLF